MENIKYVKKTAILLGIAVAIFLLGPFFVFAYSDDTTHPALTVETAKFFNLRFPELVLTDEEMGLVRQGSMDEDEAPRWLHHFYDPIYERGLWGQLSSKEWAKATTEQAGFASLGAGSLTAYFSADSDYSWERAVYEYAWGDKERGLGALGHTLHLIQDASVPDHTRNDAHPPFLHFGSPYESWAGQFNEQNTEIISKLKNEKPAPLNSLDEHFYNLASYSNNNFFSKDTISNVEYQSPVIDNVERDINNNLYAVTHDEVGKLRLVRLVLGTENKITPLFDKDEVVLTDYWSRLSKQAVLHGAGVMKLFFDEVGKEKETKVLYNKNKTWAQRIFDATKNIIFNIASVFYGSSITPADLESDLAVPPPSEQAAVVVATTLGENQGSEGGENEEGAETATTDNLAEGPPSGLETDDETSVELSENESVAISGSDIRDRFGLVALPSGGGAIGGGGSLNSPPPDTTPPAFPVITSPTNFSQTFTQATLTFSGTAEAGALITQDFDATSTTAVAGAWSLTLTLPQGTSTIQFFAQDQSGNKSESKEISFFVDSVSPDLTFEIQECGNSITSGCLSTSTTATLSWSSDAGDLASYELNCKINATTCDNFPKNFLATSSVQTTEALSDFNSYTLTLKAFDQAGNETQISRTIETASLPVVINEIAWMGTDASSNDEWIELYNNTSQEISLANWILRAQDGVPHFALSGQIPAKGYYLIERTDDNTISDILADLVTPFSGNGSGSGLLNTGEHLLLERITASATTTFDEVSLCGFSWCAGSNTSKKTMERVNSKIAGTSASNWSTALGEFILNGKSTNGGPINGTPKAKNSATYLVSIGAISSDKTLTKENSPYLLTGLTINSGSTLTIKPGVVIKIVSSGVATINGTIKAMGTADEPVVFTAFADDEYGGDMNADGICDPNDASSTAACPTLGYWRKFIINSSSQNSIFQNTIIRYGGGWLTSDTPSDGRAMIFVDGASPTFDGATVEHSLKHGLTLLSSSATITNSTFKNNIGDNNNTDANALYILGGGAPVITNNTFKDNLRGLYISSVPQAQVSSNIFNDNSVSAIESFGPAPSFSQNSGSGNGINAVALTGDITSAGATTTLQKNSLPYMSKGGFNVVANSVLTFEPEIVIKGHANFNNLPGKITVKKDGKMFFAGGNANDLIFTSHFDDSVGGNTDNASNAPSAGDWYGIVVEKDGIFDMSGFTLRYAGGLTTGPGSADDKTGIMVKSDFAQISNAVIENNYQNGLRLDKTDLFTLSNSTLRNHTAKTSGQASAINATGATAVLQNTTFSGNELDIKASGSYSIDLTNCSCGSLATDPSPL